MVSIEENGGPGLNDPIERMPGIGPKRAVVLSQLGIITLRDLLLHLPRTYQDRRRITPIAEAAIGNAITVEGTIVSARNIRLRGRLSLAAVKIRDGTGEMNLTFFGRGFMAKTTFKTGARGFFTGVVSQYQGPALQNPDYEIIDDEDDARLNTGRITPVYRLTEGVTQRMLRRWIHGALGALSGTLAETLPETLRNLYAFPPLPEAIRAVHFPEEPEQGERARARFAYEELLAIQIGILGERGVRFHETKRHRHIVDGPLLRALRAALPFAPTEAQVRAISDVLTDLAAPRPMCRLIQGDVGCGKTLVALHAIAAAADGGHQTALMAPTEILAEQHALHLRHMLAPLGIEVAVLTGAMRGARKIREGIASGTVHVAVGTHALIQEETSFHRLGLAIIDEQHRFGVLQRESLASKGLHPDILHMTATPIPRTLAITVYGGMDISVIDVMPPGRLPVKTRRMPAGKIPELYRYIHKQAAQGFQTYIICPLVEESEKREDLKSVIRHYEDLTEGPLAGLRTALLHGRLDAAEKEGIMLAFKGGKFDVLFSTTVIEVGIDVAKAVIMAIEDAAQFGLTQLHQLRGRVGRGPEQSYCFLLGEPKTKEGKERLEVLCRCTSGFDIAEEDLRLRGPGEFYGIRQAGLSDLRVADLIRDVRLLDYARRDAQALLAADPGLASAEHRTLAQAAARFGWIRA